MTDVLTDTRTSTLVNLFVQFSIYNECMCGCQGFLNNISGFNLVIVVLKAKAVFTPYLRVHSLAIGVPRIIGISWIGMELPVNQSSITYVRTYVQSRQFKQAYF